MAFSHSWKAVAILLVYFSPRAAIAAPSNIPPYWARESYLHADVLAGIAESSFNNNSNGDMLVIPYDFSLPPRSYDDEQTAVTVGLNIFKIRAINIATSSMQLNAWLQMSWKDPRLAWDPTDERTNYNADTNPESTQIWVPDFELINQDEPIVNSFAPKQAQVHPDGTVFWSRVGRIDALCAFSGLKKHPFDKNECTIDFSGWTRSALFANYQFRDPPVTWGGTGTAASTYQEYRLVQDEVRASINTYYYDCCPDEPWPTLTYTFVFERITTALYLQKLAIPVILMTILASAVFWFDVRCGERLGYGITILLAITAVEIIAGETLPTCSEWLWIEALSTGSFIFSTACLMESCVVTHVYYKQRKEDLTEWIQVGTSKKNVDDDLEDPTQKKFDEEDCLSFHSCDSGDQFKRKNTPPLFTKKLAFSEETTNGYHSKRKPESKPSSEGEERRSSALHWATERNLDPESFDRVRKLDQLSWRVFAISYSLFVTMMFASLPLWKDDYQVNL